MAIFNKETALEVAYIGAGAVAGKIVGAKVYENLPSMITEKVGNYGVYVEGAIPLLAGLFLPSLAGNSTIVRGLANGMIASGASTIVGELLAKTGVVSGVGNVMMGNVMMGNVPAPNIIDTPLMGGNDGFSDYSDTSQDYTSSSAGEMDY